MAIRRGRSGCLAVLALRALLHLTAGCRTIPMYGGVLDPALELRRYRHDPSGGSVTSCTCCALCYQLPGCRSLSFHPETGECVLYSRVGGHRDLTEDRSQEQRVQFYFLSGHSESGEFCQRDADCLAPGEQCRAKICTLQDTITCQHLFEMKGRLLSKKYWAFIGEVDIIVHCFWQRPGAAAGTRSC